MPIAAPHLLRQPFCPETAGADSYPTITHHMKQTEAVAAESIRNELLLHVRRMTRNEGLAVAKTFYAELFSRCPDLGKHFAGLDLDTQATKLWNVLRLVVASDGDAAGLGEAVNHVARRHVLRGVKPQDYTAFTAVLIDVLAYSQRVVPPEQAKQIWSHEIHAVTSMILARHH